MQESLAQAFFVRSVAVGACLHALEDLNGGKKSYFICLVWEEFYQSPRVRQLFCGAFGLRGKGLRNQNEVCSSILTKK